MENFDLISKITEHFYDITSDNVIGVCYANKIKDGLLTEQESLTFIVSKKLPLEEIPKEDLIDKTISISGLTFVTDVIEMDITTAESCPSNFYTWQTVPPLNRNKTRPIKGGLNITNYTKLSDRYGTLGFLAIDNETNSLVGVTNNHVIVPDAFSVELRNSSGVKTNIKDNLVTQGELGKNIDPFQDSIGYVKRYQPLKMFNNEVDVALLTINPTVISNSTSFTQVGLTGWTLQMDFATTEEIDGLKDNNILLYSSGATTGPKGEGDMKLKVYSMSNKFNINYNLQNNPTTVEYVRSIFFIASGTTTPSGTTCPYPVERGDSGSVLIGNFNGIRKIVGLVFALSSLNINGVYIPYYGIACRIDDIVKYMNISPWNGQITNFSNIAATETICSPDNITQPYIIKDGKKYWQAGMCN